jgi:methyltransferase (TIGR00027 family)
LTIFLSWAERRSPRQVLTLPEHRPCDAQSLDVVTSHFSHMFTPRAEVALAARYYVDNVLCQDYLMTRATKCGARSRQRFGGVEIAARARSPRSSHLPERTKIVPDNTAVRVALWRALHLEADPAPHVFEDRIGLALVAPEEGWQQRPDMSAFTRPFRASIVARARFVEDLVEEQAARDVAQYVILGAGLDTFAQRRPELASRLRVFEVDAPETQAWKEQRLSALGFAVPPFLRFVPVDFERGESWLPCLAAAGFDTKLKTVVTSLGVSMYLGRDAIVATLREVATLAAGSTLVMSFMLPIALAEPDVRPGIEAAARGARASGTPWVSFFTPEELLALARAAGFRVVEHVSSAALSARYFAGRSDGLRLPNNSEELLVATT